MSIGKLTLLAILAVAALSAFFATRNKARRSHATRSFLLILNGFAIAIGLILSLWLPDRIPETEGSPASLVGTLMLWIFGGGLAVLGTFSFFGALLASPFRNQDNRRQDKGHP